MIIGIIYHYVTLYNVEEEHDLQLHAAKRQHYDNGFSKGWAQCRQAISMKMESIEARLLEAKRNQLAVEAANARLKYFDETVLGYSKPYAAVTSPVKGVMSEDPNEIDPEARNRMDSRVLMQTV